VNRVFVSLPIYPINTINLLVFAKKNLHAVLTCECARSRKPGEHQRSDCRKSDCFLAARVRTDRSRTWSPWLRDFRVRALMQ